jgi:demethylmenaquinone methyltransferase/2-methoxy-6-polyprenyl-1,4-benzoquinol methylase
MRFVWVILKIVFIDVYKGKNMDTEALGKTALGRIFINTIAAIMESRLRYRFFGADKILAGAGICPGMRVLEVGCGTGIFTIPAGRMLGPRGSLVAMDMLPDSVAAVANKVQDANLGQVVRVVKGDALNTQLEGGSLDEVILFGVIPAPSLPMERLMQEMHRILKPGGTMAVWPPSWVHPAIVQSGWFRFINRQNGVSNYQSVNS